MCQFKIWISGLASKLNHVQLLPKIKNTSQPFFTVHTPGSCADFSGAVFSHAHFQKIAQISSLCNFHYIPSLMRFWLLMNQVLRIWFMRIFARPKNFTSHELEVFSRVKNHPIIRLFQKIVLISQWPLNQSQPIYW